MKKSDLKNVYWVEDREKNVCVHVDPSACILLNAFWTNSFFRKVKNYLAIAQENVTECLFPSKINRCTLAAAILYLY